MSFFRTIFHRGPTIQQQHVDHWVKDRKAAMQEYYQKRKGGMDFDVCLKEYRDMLNCERMLRTFEDASEKERVQKLKEDLPKASRFTRLRQRRGLPFKSRRQP